MTFQAQIVQLSPESMVEEFFRQSEGNWRSQRRYYTLKDGETQEVISSIAVHFLEQGNEELIQLARLHKLADETMLKCGALTTWESNYIGPSPKQSTGATVFGVLGTALHRDRGFSTSKPIVAQFTMRDPKTMCLRTEYSKNVFEEELRLIGTQYRTRQTIISRAGEEQMIGQYLEKRI
ncbi:phycobiliprotein lyase [Nostocaceae cyanobacterium CENA369]|uniref:Chromophore lyase CpcS/CpeS n=1 Tax=Dendronalium phyllosphericum CENA369 TaxID=1725256 RepID=A0A8J7I5Z7_9NOST|nr:phycobiliprotein lyase [Dendronalium phyllosphericum]MBH8574788.1 phycobiliprotein lyase [Dendronalium phyllosphericum CENA369]